MRVLVCGGRDYDDWPKLSTALHRADDKRKITVIIQGGAKGADALAKEWAEVLMVPVETFPADWKQFGPRAGPMRNQDMIDAGQPDAAIAFPGGKGTADMVRRLEAASVVVWKPYG
jgi:hypothetical protein